MNAHAEPPRTPGHRGGGHALLDPGALTVAVIVVLMVAPVFAWVGLAPVGSTSAQANFELLMVAASALLTLLIAVIQVFVHIQAFGGTVVRGNRDNYPVASGLAARLVRAHANAVENLLPFTAMIFVAQSFGVANRWTASASALFLAARIVHGITYSAGVTIVRSAAFYAGVFAVVLIALQLPWLLIFHPH